MDNKVVIVTGAASGIGESIAEKFNSSMFKVVLVDKDQTNLERVLKKCHETGSGGDSSALSLCGDLTEEGFCKTVIESTVERLGRVDVLVNNAGTARPGQLGDISMADYDAVMNTNARSVFMLTQMALPHLKASKGCVVNITSMNADIHAPSFTPYCMSKAAVAQFTRSAAIELAPFGVRVNAVAPGPVYTSLLRQVTGFGKEQYQEVFGDVFPLNSGLNTTDIASAVIFLASDENKAITGETLHVDCGLSVKQPGS